MARGSKPGERRGGRQKGTLNRRTKVAQSLAEKAAAEGITPLEVMLQAMREHYGAGRLDEAAEKAKDAAPYMHPKLSNIDQHNTGATTVTLVVDTGVKRD